MPNCILVSESAIVPASTAFMLAGSTWSLTPGSASAHTASLSPPEALLAQPEDGEEDFELWLERRKADTCTAFILY